MPEVLKIATKPCNKCKAELVSWVKSQNGKWYLVDINDIGYRLRFHSISCGKKPGYTFKVEVYDTSKGQYHAMYIDAVNENDIKNQLDIDQVLKYVHSKESAFI